ncbi:UTP--glucose-1-phosphate uridylyltransferase [Ectobacillus antri]|jgi:UTP--glucose-1-phosphate uridylyltransferase|uniref:UTP--glucose-1-phosphate uridylyltransferase n=1 Tax=Ectobacillus antri TaxID=2486280 RepID=A0ABT6H5D8_9BACI|nr:UTP--glucose-1-phosphate uridylyltransferase [Ectobacillus antri]MDG4656629.1 UTP--glucose-1-phosphate uridylyltransferase [Ectobacillus antri]MDG5754008.1 UTP--glucose-1-phosphate uridylyltransferase [Ectobacillus antri]
MVKKAVIPAAGYGTRNLPITKVLPKEMFPIAGRPAIDYIVREAVEAGIEEIFIIISRSKNMIMDYFDRSLELEVFLQQSQKSHLLPLLQFPKVNIQFMRQSYAKGLGDAVRLAEKFVGNEPFAVLLPDQIFINETANTLQHIIATYEQHKGDVVGVKAVAQEDLKLYGVIQGTQLSEGLYNVTDIIEKPQSNPPSNLAVIGRYIFTPQIFSYLNKTGLGVGNEIQLTDAIKQMISGYTVKAKVLESECYDLGKEEEYMALLNYMFNKK